MVGPKNTLFLDEISTGLDSSITFLIVRCVRNFVHALQARPCAPCSFLCLSSGGAWQQASNLTVHPACNLRTNVRHAQDQEQELLKLDRSSRCFSMGFRWVQVGSALHQRFSAGLAQFQAAYLLRSGGCTVNLLFEPCPGAAAGEAAEGGTEGCEV